MPALLQIITDHTIPFVYSLSLLTNSSYLLCKVSLDEDSIRISIWFEEDVNIILGACQREVATHVRYQRATIRFILFYYREVAVWAYHVHWEMLLKAFCIAGI